MRRWVLFLLLISTCAIAEQGPSSMVVRYGSADWNTNSHKIETAFVFVRDKSTGKIAKILLEETAPNSSLFEGRFLIQWDQSKAAPDFYVPPPKLAKSGNTKQFQNLLRAGKLKPHSVFAHLENKRLIYEIFDTDAQAEQARKIYEQASASPVVANAPSIKTGPIENPASESTAAREAARLRMEQIEAQRLQKQQLEMQRMAESAREARKTQAAELAANASKDYEQSEYQKAVDEFHQASELDPENHTYYFKYGVSLYRLKKYDDALVALQLAPVSGMTDTAKNYYMGLIHYKLNELTDASDSFQRVRAAHEPKLSPAAAYYLGLIEVAQNKLPQAKEDFQYVLDNSQNAPGLDNKAEENIERIDAMMANQNVARRKWAIDASESLIYDSDILLNPNNGAASTGNPSNQGGGRVDTNLELTRQLYYSDSAEFKAVFNGNYMWSFNSTFAAGDPTDLTFDLPYTLKSMWHGKPSRLTFTPGFETLAMDYNNVSGGTSRPDIMDGYTGEVDWQLQNRPDWYSDTMFSIAHDNSLLVIGSPVYNATAWMYTVMQTESKYFDAKKQTALVGYAGFTYNAALGDYYAYNMIDLGVIYSAPIRRFKNVLWDAAITDYRMVFPNKNNGVQNSETDDDATLTAGLTKIVNAHWNGILTASYTTNSSDVPASQYNKYIVMATVNYHWDDAPINTESSTPANPLATPLTNPVTNPLNQMNNPLAPQNN